MSTKQKDVRRFDPETSVNQPFKMLHVRGKRRIFFKEDTPNFDIFSNVFYSGRVNLYQFEEEIKL